MPERIVIYKPGGYDRLQLESFDRPAPQEREIQVAVRAIGVNYADCIVRMGLYESARVYSGYPICPGFEVAGTVAAAGSEVSEFNVGDRVVALTRFNAYATSVTVPASQVRSVPVSLGFTAAAALPTVFLTAWYAACELGQVRAGQTVLVHSAAGGVGSMLVPLCKHAGCRVVGVVGNRDKIDYVRERGADAVIVRGRHGFRQELDRAAPESYDTVFDANGLATLKESYRSLRSPGRLIIYGFHSMMPKGKGRPNPVALAINYLRTPRFNPFDLTASNKSVLGFNLSFLFERAELLTPGLRMLDEGLSEGWLQMPKITPFPIAEAARAHRALESGTTMGKLVLIVD